MNIDTVKQFHEVAKEIVNINVRDKSIEELYEKFDDIIKKYNIPEYIEIDENSKVMNHALIALTYYFHSLIDTEVQLMFLQKRIKSNVKKIKLDRQ